MENETNNPSMESQIIFVAKDTGYNFEYIYNMTIRKFKTLFDMGIKDIEYKINKMALMTGHLDPKEKIQNYMYEKPKDYFESLFQSADAFKDKIGL